MVTLGEQQTARPGQSGENWALSRSSILSEDILQDGHFSGGGSGEALKLQGALL